MKSKWKSALAGGGLGMVAALAPAPDAAASHQVPGFEADASRLVGAITTKGVVAHKNELQWIADYRDGNRAATTSGHAASVSYVRRKLDAAGYRTSVRSFDYPYFKLRGTPSLSAGGTSYVDGRDFTYMEFSGGGSAAGRLVAIDVQIPPPASGSSTSGCEAADFPPAGAEPAIAVIQRGTCDFSVKVANAAAAGYDGVVIFNEGQPDRTDLFPGTLGEPAALPTLFTTYALGQKLVTLADAGGSGRVEVKARSEMRKTYNLVAETAGGRADRVVVVGAHLDSVREGPGINDNASGSGAILELALQMAKLKIQPKNKVRFGWWGAEELGLFGSTAYVDSLSEQQAASIMAYLNFDMIASHNYAWLIQQGNPDSAADKVVEQVFTKYFQRARLPYQYTPADGRSDYAAFSDIGIPVGGLFSGADAIKTEKQAKLFGGVAGQPLDPCYHKACDTNRYISRRSTLVLSRAIADTVYKFAMTERDIRLENIQAAQARVMTVQTGQEARYRGPHLAR